MGNLKKEYTKKEKTEFDLKKSLRFVGCFYKLI